MKVRQGPARAALISTLVTAVLAATGSSPAAAAATPPYEPDANAAGSITFYDAAGNVVTSGSTTALVGYAVGTAPLTSTGNKASLYGYLPKSGQAPGSFSGELLAGPTTYPIAAAPAAVSGSSNPAVKPVTGDLTFGDLAKDFPNTATDVYAGLYQIRIKTTDSKYLATDIQINGTTWQEVYPVSSGAVTTSTSLAVTESGTTQTLTATVSPSTAAGSVQFFDGGTALGSPVAVSGGVARTTATLALGSHSLSASFTPTDAVAYTASSSPTVSYVVRSATTTVLNAQATVVTAGTRYTVSGRVTGLSVASRVLLRIAPRGASARIVALPTTSTGTFSTIITAASTTAYTATFAGDSTHKPSTSVARTTIVRWKATVASIALSGRQVIVNARILPVKGSIVVRLYERRSTGLVGVAVARTGSTGGARLVTAALVRGYHTFVVNVPATTSNATGYSAYFTVRV